MPRRENAAVAVDQLCAAAPVEHEIDGSADRSADQFVVFAVQRIKQRQLRPVDPVDRSERTGSIDVEQTAPRNIAVFNDARNNARLCSVFIRINRLVILVDGDAAASGDLITLYQRQIFHDIYGDSCLPRSHRADGHRKRLIALHRKLQDDIAFRSGIRSVSAGNFFNRRLRSRFFIGRDILVQRGFA